MKVAAIYDIHGNLPALEAVLAVIRRLRVELVIVGGDVLPGPMPRETLDLLRELDLPKKFIRGNGDREVLTRMQGMENSDLPESVRAAIHWNAEQLQQEDADFIATWPLTFRLEVEGLGAVLFCHATPASDLSILTRATPEEEADRELGDVAADVVVCGHTHVQYDRRVGRTRLVNAGSVGMPYEGSADARWALLGADGIELLATPYDAVAALDALSRTGFPLVQQWLAPVLLGQVTADEATDEFERRRRGA